MHQHRTKVLFILKERHDYWGQYNCSHPSSGLFNSANFVRQMLEDLGVETKLVHVKDGHGIDKEVTEFKPTHVILEAIWCPPSKFDVLIPLHPDVTWIVRNHSEIPFLAGESMSIKWMFEYIEHDNVIFSSNSPRAQRETVAMARVAHPEWTEEELQEKFLYLPNYYPTDFVDENTNNNGSEIHIGCFGSIRPLKNQLLQAMAAVEFANSIGKDLVFHINGSRIEFNGDSIIKNLRSLFTELGKNTRHRMVEHGWLDLPAFLEVVSKLDIGLQVAFSETFNIVAANFTEECVPIVVSDEVPWGDKSLSANPTDSSDIVAKLTRAWKERRKDPTYNPHARSLRKYSHKTKKVWGEYFADDDSD